MSELMTLAIVLQDLFTLTADLLARVTGFIKRPNKLTGSAVAQTLVFRWLANPSVGTPCRLVALRCPEEVTNRRRQKLRESSSKRQRTASALSLALCACSTRCRRTHADSGDGQESHRMDVSQDQAWESPFLR